MEAWVAMRMANWTDRSDVNELTSQITAGTLPRVGGGILPEWAARIVGEHWYRREFATAALNGAEHAAIQKSPATLALPDLGASLHEAVSKVRSSIMEPNSVRAIMRINATLLLREQIELIRDARVRLAAGRPVESRDSGVLPGVRWELTADAEKGTVAIRLAGAPEWIVKKVVTPDEFWLLPLDGSVPWQFRRPAPTTGQD
jgi:hypothetical protein